MSYQNNPERIIVSHFEDDKAKLGYYPKEILSDTT